MDQQRKSKLQMKEDWDHFNISYEELAPEAKRMQVRKQINFQWRKRLNNQQESHFGQISTLFKRKIISALKQCLKKIKQHLFRT